MADFSVYPNAIDGYAQIPLVVEDVTKTDAVTFNRLRSAIINIESELGINPSSTELSVGSRLDLIETNLNASGYKNPVRIATDFNVNLQEGAPLIVSGITLHDGDRVLVWSQINQEENGIYSIDSAGIGFDGFWSRSIDANTSALLIPGTEVFVVEGTYKFSKFYLVTPGPYIIGSTKLEFAGGLNFMESIFTEYKELLCLYILTQ